MQLGRFETGRRSDGAVDVDGGAAGPADDVVVVVADALLVAGGTSRGLDPAEKIYCGERTERVIHGLPRNTAQLVVDRVEDRLHVCVGSGPDLFEDGEAHGRDASARGAQKLDVVPHRRHEPGH